MIRLCLAAAAAFVVLAPSGAMAQEAADALSQATESQLRELGEVPPAALLTLKAKLPEEWDVFIADYAAELATKEGQSSDPMRIADRSYQRFLSARLYQSATATPAAIKRIYSAKAAFYRASDQCVAPAPRSASWIALRNLTAEQYALAAQSERALIDAIAQFRTGATPPVSMKPEHWKSLRAALASAGATPEQEKIITSSEWRTLKPSDVCVLGRHLFSALAEGGDDVAVAYWGAWVRPRPIASDPKQPGSVVFSLAQWNEAMATAGYLEPMRVGFPARWAGLRRGLQEGVSKRLAQKDMWGLIHSAHIEAIAEAQRRVSRASGAEILRLYALLANGLEAGRCKSAAAGPSSEWMMRLSRYETQLYAVMNPAKPEQHAALTEADWIVLLRTTGAEAIESASRLTRHSQSAGSASLTKLCLSQIAVIRGLSQLPPEVAGRFWVAAGGPNMPVRPIAGAPMSQQGWSSLLSDSELQEARKLEPVRYGEFMKSLEDEWREGADSATIAARVAGFLSQTRTKQAQTAELARERAPLAEIRAVLGAHRALTQQMLAEHSIHCARWITGLGWPEFDLGLSIQASVDALNASEDAAVSAALAKPTDWPRPDMSDFEAFRRAYENVGGDLAIFDAIQEDRVSTISDTAICQAGVDALDAQLALPDAVLGKLWRSRTRSTFAFPPRPSADGTDTRSPEPQGIG